MFSSLPFKVSSKACKPFYEPQRNNTIQRGGCRLTTDHSKNQKGRKEDKAAGRVCFHLYHPRYPSKPTGHFTNQKGRKGNKEAGMGMFSSLPSKVSFKAYKPFYEPQRNNGGQSSRKGTFSSLLSIEPLHHYYDFQIKPCCFLIFMDT